jgi:hypothetical protein
MPLSLLLRGAERDRLRVASPLLAGERRMDCVPGPVEWRLGLRTLRRGFFSPLEGEPEEGGLPGLEVGVLVRWALGGGRRAGAAEE